MDATTNISNILQFSVGNVYGRLDMFSSVLWSVSVFIEAALFFYATCRCVSFVIGKNAHFIISLCMCVAVYAVQVFALTDPMIFSLTVTAYSSAIITLVMAAAIPCLALACTVIHSVKHKRKNRADAREGK